MFKGIDEALLLEIGLRILVVLIILSLTALLAKLVKRAMARKEKLAGMDKTQYKFIAHLIRAFIYFIGFVSALYSIPSLRGLSTSIFAGSGILAIIIGLASQQAMSNIVSGFFIAMFKPFRLGDRVKLIGKDFIGIVEDITLRHTVIRTFDNKRVIIPNSTINSAILENANIVDKKTFKFFEIGISYDSDIDRAIAIIREEVLKHPNFLDNRTDKEKKEKKDLVKIRLLKFTESAMIIRAWIWTKDPGTAFNIGCDLNIIIKKRFDQEGIEMPHTHQTIVLKKDIIRKREAMKQHYLSSIHPGALTEPSDTHTPLEKNQYPRDNGEGTDDSTDQFSEPSSEWG